MNNSLGLAGVATVDQRRHRRDRRDDVHRMERAAQRPPCGQYSAPAAGMPPVFGIGVSPLLQWIILPAAMVVAFRSLDPMPFGTQTPSEPLSAHWRTKGST